MSEEKAKLMEKELTEKRKLTSDVKDSISLKVFVNLVLAIVVMGVFFILNSLFVFKSTSIFKVSCKIVSIIGVIVAIVLFEISFRKKKYGFMANGIELLVSSVLIMFMPYLYYVIAIKYVRALIIVPVFLSIYYVIKSIIAYRMMVKKHHDSLSDVKEILETDSKSYLDEESTKTIKAKKEKSKNNNSKQSTSMPKSKSVSKATVRKTTENKPNNKNTKSAKPKANTPKKSTTKKTNQK